jgi:hypothetical protein
MKLCENVPLASIPSDAGDADAVDAANRQKSRITVVPDTLMR